MERAISQELEEIDSRESKCTGYVKESGDIKSTGNKRKREKK